MKKISQLLLTASAVAFLAGCTPDHLATGCYHPASPEDGCIACVYEDIIFLRVKLPENSDRPNQNLDWAGKYKLDKDTGVITLQMPKEAYRNWQFYFNLRQAGNTLKIDDYSRQKTYTLISDAPQETPSPADVQHAAGDIQPME